MNGLLVPNCSPPDTPPVPVAAQRGPTRLPKKPKKTSTKKRSIWSRLYIATLAAILSLLVSGFFFFYLVGTVERLTFVAQHPDIAYARFVSELKTEWEALKDFPLYWSNKIRGSFFPHISPFEWTLDEIKQIVAEAGLSDPLGAGARSAYTQDGKETPADEHASWLHRPKGWEAGAVGTRTAGEEHASWLIGAKKGAGGAPSGPDPIKDRGGVGGEGGGGGKGGKKGKKKDGDAPRRPNGW